MMSLILSAWFGILTSISPCPLATNIAAISFISKKISNPKDVVISGLFYTFGRTLLYITLGMIVGISTSLIPQVSNLLQRYSYYFLGPILILISLALSGFFNFKIGSNYFCKIIEEKLKNKKYLSSFLLGIVFASAFCATSAALFFGNIISGRGNIINLSVYGIATGIPTILISFILAFSVNSAGSVYNKIIIFEKYFRRITAAVFLIIGVYYTMRISVSF